MWLLSDGPSSTTGSGRLTIPRLRVLAALRYLVVPLGFEPRSRGNLPLAVYKTAALPLSYETNLVIRHGFAP